MTVAVDTPVLAYIGEDGIPFTNVFNGADGLVIAATDVLTATTATGTFVSKDVNYLDTCSEIDVVGNNNAYMYLRATDTSNSVAVLGSAATNQVIIRQSESAVLTTNVIIPVALTSPYTLRCDMVGRTLTTFVNGVEIDSRLLADIDYTGYFTQLLFLKNSFASISRHSVDPA